MESVDPIPIVRAAPVKLPTDARSTPPQSLHGADVYQAGGVGDAKDASEPPLPKKKARIRTKADFPADPTYVGDFTPSTVRPAPPSNPEYIGKAPTIGEYLSCPIGQQVLDQIQEDAAYGGLPHGWSEPIVRDDVPIYNDHRVVHANTFNVDEARTEVMLPQVLTWMDQNGMVDNLLFAGSGFQQTAKRTLGVDRVVHLSKEGTPWGYFQHLGEGLKVEGDVLQLPFANEAFSATLVCGLPADSAAPAVAEIARVTAQGGYVLFTANGTSNPRSVLRSFRQSLQEVPLPGIFSGFHLFRNTPRAGQD